MKLFLTLLSYFIFAGLVQGQIAVKIGGLTKESISQENINGVTVFYKEKKQSVLSNDVGFFSLNVNAGDTATLIFSHTSFESKTIRFLFVKDTFFVVSLFPATKELQEIKVQATNLNNENADLGVVSIPIKTLAKIPSLFGEKDLIKAIQLLPGVQTGSEGNTGYYVRGGGEDQNLILLDGTTIYNISHLFGFFSLFPADAIKNVELIKGGFPARYSGRLSSVLDIKLKDGNKQKIQGNISAGLLSSKISIEGPVKKSKSSFMITGRRTYIDLLAKPFLQSNNNKNGYNFYDGIAKLNFILTQKSNLSISVYGGRDNYSATVKEVNQSNNQIVSKATSRSGMQWGNFTAAIKWNMIVNSKMSFNQSLNYTRYNYKTEYVSEVKDIDGNSIPQKSYAYLFESSVGEISYKSEIDWFVSDKAKIKSGIGYSHQLFTPSSALLRSNNNGLPVAERRSSGNTPADLGLFFVEGIFSLNHRIQMNVGLHNSLYAINSKSFFSIQPRLTGKYLMNEQSNLQGSFSYIVQPIHLLTNNGPGLPVDLWVPATKNVPPQRAFQYSFGYLIKPKTGYEVSIDMYYKVMQRVIEYAEGANFINSADDWEKRVETGNGISYGAEFFLQKKAGMFTGWIGYTLSWSKRKFDNLNNGNWFWYKYDHRHDIKLVFIYEPSIKFDLSFNFVFNSGNKVTIPDIVYTGLQNGFPQNYAGFMLDVNSQIILNSSSRNNFNFKTYHRSDISFNFNKEKKRGTRTWNISVYNIYSRRNPYFYYLKENSNGNLTLTQFSLFPILPSVSYQFKWK